MSFANDQHWQKKSYLDHWYRCSGHPSVNSMFPGDWKGETRSWQTTGAQFRNLAARSHFPLVGESCGTFEYFQYESVHLDVERKLYK